MNQFTKEWYEQQVLKDKSRRKPTKLEQNISNESLVTLKAKKRNTGKVQIRYTSVCNRLLDPDNAASKYHTDALRYSGVIEGDSFAQVEIITNQRKCVKPENPHTIIEIFYP